MILMIDNYDSFTYNLVQYIEQMNAPVTVIRNDKITLEEIVEMPVSGIVLSPGPGRPEGAGVTLSIIKSLSGKIPILGVCLGHQSIASAFGGAITSAKSIMHGKTSLVRCDGKGIFNGIKRPFQAMRYHSLAVDPNHVPRSLSVTATSEDGEIMGLRHNLHPTEGIQFHPESIMTPMGKRLLRNFLKIAGFTDLT